MWLPIADLSSSRDKMDAAAFTFEAVWDMRNRLCGSLQPYSARLEEATDEGEKISESSNGSDLYPTDAGYVHSSSTSFVPAGSNLYIEMETTAPLSGKRKRGIAGRTDSAPSNVSAFILQVYCAVSMLEIC